MSTTPGPRPWTNQDIVLFHGSILRAAQVMAAGAIDLKFCMPFTDFGPGFYTTTLQYQAESWAKKRAVAIQDAPALLKITVPRDEMSRLETMSFVGAERDDPNDFWSFVEYCRKGAVDHGRAKLSGSGAYDLVVGPVTAFWDQRYLMQGADQYSFHTVQAVALLNRCRSEVLPV